MTYHYQQILENRIWILCQRLWTLDYSHLGVEPKKSVIISCYPHDVNWCHTSRYESYFPTIKSGGPWPPRPPPWIRSWQGMFRQIYVVIAVKRYFSLKYWIWMHFYFYFCINTGGLNVKKFGATYFWRTKKVTLWTCFRNLVGVFRFSFNHIYFFLRCFSFLYAANNASASQHIH